LCVGTVAFETVRRENRPNVAIELDRFFSCNGRRAADERGGAEPCGNQLPLTVGRGGVRVGHGMVAVVVGNLRSVG
jgi:hypothetical protein